MVTVCLDTNIFIYHFQENVEFGPKAKKVFELLSGQKIRGVTSIISLIELLSFKTDKKEVEKLKNLYLTIPNLKTVEVTQPVALVAARIRREYGFRTSDAIQLATGLVQKASTFITNDGRLKKFKGLKIQLLSG